MTNPEARLSQPLSPQRLGAIRRRLLQWYAAHQQPFPWRTAGDPYAALVAAVCAQQTQMPRVLAIYERWMRAFPTVQHLAAASDADALRVWARAGYPRRALYLRRTAAIVVRDHDGQVPSDESDLLKLPGVGPFTAAIVRCFGFGIDSTAVDTNIVRLFGRLLFGDLQPARETRASEVAWAAAQLVPRGQALLWNPAVMDFGAAVCSPRPKCGDCPLAELCAARERFAAGETAEPVRAQGRFTGSRRQLRGLLMRELRAHDGPLPRNWLIDRVCDGREADRGRVESALSSLIDDELARFTEGEVWLGADPVDDL